MRKNGCVKIDSTEMYYVSFGTGTKKLVVLPGLSDGLATVKGKAFLLAGSYKKFFDTYTVYMFSRKEQMSEGYSMEQMADDQVTVMKQLGIDKASVLGVSQGGMIAQCIAIRHPEVMDKLILAVTSPWANDMLSSVVSTWIELAKKGDHILLMADTAKRMYSKEYLDKYERMLPIVARVTKPKSYERFYKNANAILRFDVRNDLRKISCPTYIIAGDDDNTVGNDAPHELKAGISNSELYIYEGLGHGAFEEAKDFYDRIYDFLQ